MTKIKIHVPDAELEALVDEIKSVLSEKRFAMAMDLIEERHAIGETIVTHILYAKYGKGQGSLIADLAKALKMSEVNLYYCTQFYIKYPDLEHLLSTAFPDKKTITWTQIRTELLPERVCDHEIKIEKTEFIKRTKTICENCRKILETRQERYDDIDYDLVEKE